MDSEIKVIIEDETVWATQKSIAQLFEVEIPTISYHINNMFKEGELQRTSTVRKILTVQTEGNRQVKREMEYYNLDMIISVVPLPI